MPKKFTVQAGRQIYLDDRPFISIGREGATHPADADTMCRSLCEMLNRSRDPEVKKIVAAART